MRLHIQIKLEHFEIITSMPISVLGQVMWCMLKYIWSNIIIKYN